MKIAAKGILFLTLAIGGYSIALHRDTKNINGFCSEMQSGLDVNRVAEIANKYDVGLKYVRDPTSAINEKLGVKLSDQANTWFFVVGAPMTMGEFACGVYHDNKVILSAKVME